MLGKPIFKQGDLVSFYFEIEGEKKKIDGAVYVVDVYGTDDQGEEPSYDIEAFFRGEMMLFKHIRESEVSLR